MTRMTENETEYGYLGFEADVTDHLKKGEANVVEVWAKVRHDGRRNRRICTRSSSPSRRRARRLSTA